MSSQWWCTTQLRKDVSITCENYSDILVCPKSQKARYRDLETKELFEISLAIQLLTKFLQKEHGTDSATVSIQEGKSAGQTINHLHVHIIPRKPGDFKNNDEIYPLLETFDDE